MKPETPSTFTFCWSARYSDKSWYPLPPGGVRVGLGGTGVLAGVAVGVKVGVSVGVGVNDGVDLAVEVAVGVGVSVGC